ncbi:hypothetical protein F9288_16740 [Sphingomonas sp. CL5.1]|uniref:DUF4286 family protein n=1 Tax=Sphingomonas sp. CL5.1 TaxID=2653203 RepID=UPI0015821E0B|nr:DUF4286 family protein [Sphingomonas sp. CL5.1]QKS01091.1 hypothetical protein F9288_16740 [Sphingomonas sp. CL5.1]
MRRCKLMVMTNAVEGRGEEFNRWYTDVHIPDVLKLPGVVGGQRFARTEAQRGDGPFPWEYLAIYDCETDDLEGLVAALKATAGTAAMPISDALAEDRFVCFFEELTDRREAVADKCG